MGAVLLAITIRKRRTDRERAGLLLWGGSLVCIGLTVSLGQGIIHPYYTVALAAPLGGLVGIATMGLWERRSTWVGRLGLAGGLAATVWWGYVLLGRTPNWFPALRPFVLVAGAMGVLAILLLPLLRSVPKLADRRSLGARPRRRAGCAALLDRGDCGHTAQRRYSVGDPDRPGRVRGTGRRSRWWLPRRWSGWRLPPCLRRWRLSRCRYRRRLSRRRLPRRHHGQLRHRYREHRHGRTSRSGTGNSANTGNRRSTNGFGGFPGGTTSPFGGRGGVGRAFGAARGGAAGGGFLSSSTSNAALTKKLQANASQLHLGRGDGELQQRRRLPAGQRRPGHGHRRLQRNRSCAEPGPVREVRLRRARSTTTSPAAEAASAEAAATGGSSDDASAITSWVESHFTSETVGGVTIYNLTSESK